MLSASADGTIKFWPISMQRCLHTFSYHDDSVWSLFSSHPNLERFYSGDRSGLVCKVDMEGCGDIAEAECVVICKDDDATSPYSASPGINSIVAVDDTYVWTASASSSIQRWKDVLPRSQRIASRPMPKKADSSSRLMNVESLPLLSRTDTEASDGIAHHNDSERRAVSFAPGLGITKDGSDVSPFFTPSVGNTPVKPSFMARYSSDRRNIQDLTLHEGTAVLPELNGLPLESLVCLDPDAGYNATSSLSLHRPNSIPSTSLRQQAHSLNRVPSYPHSSLNSGDSPLLESPTQPFTSTARLEYEERDIAKDAIPLRLTPDETLYGRTGLVRCEMLNDRRTVITLDTASEIAVWDIVLARCIGVMDKSQLADTARRRRESQSSQETTSSIEEFLASEQQNARHGSVMKEVLELVKTRIEGEGVTNSWATIDVRVGALSVHLDEARCFAGEAYLDEATFHSVQADDYQRINLGKIVLRNLLDGFLQAELRKVESTQGTPAGPPGRLQRSLAPSHINLSGNDLFSGDHATPRLGPLTIATALATPAPSLALPPKAEDMPSVNKDLAAIPQSPAPNPRATPAATSNLEGDYFSLPNGSPRVPAQTPGTAAANGFVGKLRNLGRLPKRTTVGLLEEPSNTPVVETAPEVAVQPVRPTYPGPFTLAGWQEIPRIAYHDALVYYLAEESSDSAAWPVIYRALVSATYEHIQALEHSLPSWVINVLLYNQMPFSQPPKITFVLEPWHGAASGLPEMPAG